MLFHTGVLECFRDALNKSPPLAFNLAAHFRDGLQGQPLFTCLAPVWRPNLNMHWLLSVVARPCQKLQVNFGTAGRWFRTANCCERLLATRNGAEPGTSESCLGPCVLGSVSGTHSRREFTQRNPSEVNQSWRLIGLGRVSNYTKWLVALWESGWRSQFDASSLLSWVNLRRIALYNTIYSSRSLSRA